MMKGFNGRALNCETQSAFAKDPPTHHHMAHTDRVSPPTLLSLYLLISCHGNRDTYNNQIEVS